MGWYIRHYHDSDPGAWDIVRTERKIEPDEITRVYATKKEALRAQLNHVTDYIAELEALKSKLEVRISEED